jgi:hypothetical protein
MKKMMTIIGTCLVLVMGAAVANAGQANIGEGSVIIADGFAAPNSYPTGLLPGIFREWCNNGDDIPECFPTVELAVVDAKKREAVGTIYAWGQDFIASPDGNTISFREFIYYDLEGGELFTISEAPGHPGGAFADPSIIIPKSGIPGAVVLLGGAEGRVAGGTGIYEGAGGKYSTRLKVEFVGGIAVYYDELYFSFPEVRIEN